MSSNIKMWQKTGQNTFNQLFPQTTIQQVINLQTTLNGLPQTVDGISPDGNHNISINHHLFIASYGVTAAQDIYAAATRKYKVILDVSSYLNTPGAYGFGELIYVDSSNASFSWAFKDMIYMFNVAGSTWSVQEASDPYCQLQKLTTTIQSANFTLNLDSFDSNPLKRKYIVATTNVTGINLTVRKPTYVREYYVLIVPGQSIQSSVSVYVSDYQNQQGSSIGDVYMPAEGLEMAAGYCLELCLLPLSDRLIVTSSQILSY